MNFIKGCDNIVADAMSHFPILGPGSFIRAGLTKELDHLVAALVDTDIDTTKQWFDECKDTLQISSSQWRDQTQE